MRERESAPAQTILVIDDDRACATGIVELLREAGYRTQALSDPRGAIQVIEGLRPTVIVLDVVMPFIDGITLCLRIRECTNSSILMLSARADPHDRTLGLRVGADDFMSKPFDADELAARVSALVRRHQQARQDPPLRIGSLVLDRRAVRASTDGRHLDLTPTEFRLLDVLAAHPGRVFTREALLEVAFGGRITGPTRAVDVHLGRLRRKLEAAGVRGLRLRARRGFGYTAVHVPDVTATARERTLSVAAPSAA